MSVKSSIYLIGFMGSSKTSVAAQIGRDYGETVLDMDKMIEKREGRSIRKIFEERGEKYFRAIETEILAEASAGDRKVVSCGGGIVLNPANIRLMRESGIIVLLVARPETTFERLRNDRSRPLLKDRMNVECIRKMMLKREKLYRNSADYIVRTNGKTIREVAREVYESVYRAGQSSL